VPVPVTSAAISARPFRGREAELALIAQAMDDPAVVGIVVAGTALLRTCSTGVRTSWWWQTRRRVANSDQARRNGD